MAKKIKKTTTTTITEEIIESNNEKTHIICILDKSGSMLDIIDDSIGGFNTLLKQQKELPDDASISVVLFDDQYEPIYENIPIKEAKELTKDIWFPRGTTALYDAIGKSINTAKAQFTKLGDEKPSKVLVCIITDGQENASREYNIDNIKKLIKDCEKDDWNFIYLAANQDAFQVGGSFGVSAGNTFSFDATSTGTKVMYNAVASSATSYRGMSTSSSDFTEKSKNLVDKKTD